MLSPSLFFYRCCCPTFVPRFTHYLTLAMFSADLRKTAHSVANQFMKPRRTTEHKRDACCRGSVTVVDFPTSIRSKCSDCVGQPVRTVAAESSTETIHARLMYSYIQATPYPSTLPLKALSFLPYPDLRFPQTASPTPSDGSRGFTTAAPSPASTSDAGGASPLPEVSSAPTVAANAEDTDDTGAAAPAVRLSGGFVAATAAAVATAAAACASL